MILLTGDLNIIPFTGRSCGINFRWLDADYTATVVRCQSLFLSVRVKNLDFNSLVDRILFVFYADKNTTVPLRGDFVLES